MLGRVICFFKGHRRGKLLEFDGAQPVNAQGIPLRMFKCPRCERTTSYKIRNAPPKPAAVGSPAADTQEYLAKQRERLR